jgi:hypothetical protein
VIEITGEQLPDVFVENLRHLGLNPGEFSKSIYGVKVRVNSELFSEVSLYSRRTVMGADSVMRGGRRSEVVIEYQFRLRNPPKGETELQAIHRGFLRREVVGHQWVGSMDIVSKLDREEVVRAASSLGFEKFMYGDGCVKMRYKSPELIVRKGLLSYETRVLYRELTQEDMLRIEVIARALLT